MMKKIVFLAIFIILMSCIIYYMIFADYYEIGKNGTIEVKLGREFHIKLDENPSTGYVNCWINEKNNSILKKIKEEYTPGLNSRLGYVGAGGTIDFTFRALKVGTDTLKIANCSFIDGKNCSDYNTTNAEISNEFVIEVRK